MFDDGRLEGMLDDGWLEGVFDGGGGLDDDAGDGTWTQTRIRHAARVASHVRLVIHHQQRVHLVGRREA